MFQSFYPRIILITGASSGIGAALARRYAAPGRTLLLLGRNAARLREVGEFCKTQQAAVITATLDVTDAPAMRQFIEHQYALHPVDLVIANAGISAGTGGMGESAEQVRRIFATNVDGVLNTVLPAIPLMKARGTGQIAIISSLAGFRGLPSSPAYSASKAAVRVFGEGLRGDLAPHGVQVSVVCPGYIQTPMTAVNDFPMPFIMTAEKAADIIIRGLRRKKVRIAFPLGLYLPVWLLTCLPPFITDPLFAALPKKPAG